ncbi:hypothetical protein MFLAVUS_010376 [Mucor flavus]|uniref:MIT domain-containing protein n=1 Tax=Mucor flavus TaxID=439312 RepID=A0ABP9ZCL4_9FUNG
MSYDTAVVINSDPFPSSSTDSKQISKLILRSALQKANAAVQCDSTNDVLGAINAYKEAILLLERVLSTVDKENDRRRLQEIHDSYSERIRLLSTITSKLESEEEWNKPTSNNKYSATKMVRKMTSSSSIEGNHWQNSPPSSSSSSSSSSVGFVSTQKEKLPVSPPILQLQTSKSTPTTNNNKRITPEPVTPIITRPPRHSSRIIKSSNRSSISSISSVESSESSSIVEQPTMALPSLKDTPIPIKKSVFRTRTSSLPKSPLMQRSSSMSTVETLLDDNDDDQDNNSTHTTGTTPIIINRPIISRPSVNGSLGSMRKKAANRLSMDGFVSKKTPSYGFILKDQINTDLEYLVDKEDEIIDDGGHLKLILALEKSMLEGAHITQKLYIPKNLWQQPNIKLSSMDVKVSACESLLNEIARLEKWSYLDDLTSSTKLLDNFEHTVDHLQTSLSKKLKRESHVESSSNSSASSINGSYQVKSTSMIHSNSRDSMSTISRMDSGKKTQSFMSWGTKLTKSVERMNAFSLTKTEDQFKHYIEVLQKLFTRLHILENWLKHYHIEKRRSRQPQHDVLIMKLVRVCTVINTVIGGFVVSDVTVLLAKWLKRGGSWVNE